MTAGLLAGRTAVVTGGANGMGAAIVRTFAAAGARAGVVLDLPTAFGGEALPDGWIGAGVDLRDDASVAAAFAEVADHLASVDVLVAAAGIVPLWTGIGDVDLDEWDDLFRVNTRGVLSSMRGALPLLSEVRLDRGSSPR